MAISNRTWLRLLVFSLTCSFPAAFGASQETSQPQPTPPAPRQQEKAQPDQFPEVVATVNGVEIHKQELISRTLAVRAQLGLPEGDLPVSIYRTVLQDMIGVELLFQSSQSSEHGATSEEVDKELDELRSQYPSETDFLQQLEAESISLDALRDALRKDVSIRKLVEQKLSLRVKVTEESVRQFYDENQSDMRQTEQLRIRHLLIRCEEDATEVEKAVARNKVDDLRKRALETGSDFSALAREFSEDPASRKEGGALTVVRGQTVESFENAAFALTPGEVSPVVETHFGFHILKLDEKIEARTLPFEEVSGRIRDYLVQMGVRKEIEMEVEMLRDKASVALFL